MTILLVVLLMVQSPLDSLVEAERGFARASAAKGTREAFLAYLADDSILFRPGPVAGKKFTAESPPPPGLLTWEPAYADIARSGDLGYTTGPFEFRRDGPGGGPVNHGHYVTVWKKQADGSWKVVIDLGIGHPAPAVKPAGVESPAGRAVPGRENDPEAGRAALLAADRGLALETAARGTAEAFLAHLAPDARLYRGGSAPFVGAAAVREALAARPGTLASRPTAAEVSRAGDLGYTYGTGEFTPTAPDGKPAVKLNYVRIWKKPPGGAWRVVLDIENPLPPG